MGISEAGLFEIMRAMIGVQKRRNEIEKEKLDVMKKIERDLRRKSDRWLSLLDSIRIRRIACDPEN